MTLHFIRYLTSQDADAYLIDDYLPAWLTTHEAWERADNQPPTLREPSDAGSIETPYYAADWYFEWSADKSVLLGNLESYTSAYSPWYQIAYYVSNHDESDHTGCEREDTLTGGDIPSGVPQL